MRKVTLFPVSVLVVIFSLCSSPVLEGHGGGGSGCGCGCGGGGGSSVVDPPIGPAFKDPPLADNVSTTPGTVEINLEAKITPVNINGTTANLMTYNGSYPGPTIRVKKGDILKVNLKNSLPSTLETNFLGYQKNFTNLHTHGWHVSPKAPSDYVMYSLAPGNVYNHVYDTMRQKPGTLSFYHPHKHGLVAEQYWAGLCGALITEDDTSVLAGYETHLMILKDITLSGSQPASHSSMMDYMQGKEGNVVMVNGQVNPRLNIKPGQVQRWRILNATNARFFNLSLQNHSMYLIGTDDGLLDKPYSLSQILISPGERVDILVKARTTTGNNKFLALPYSRMGMMTSSQITLMTMSVVQAANANNTLPASINPSAMRINSPMVSANRTFTLSMGQGRGYINGLDFDVNPLTVMSEVGTYEIWTVVNQSGMDHPFHQHVNAAQVISMSGQSASYPAYQNMPAWKDVVLVPKGGSVTMLVPIMDYDGMAMFHCHILEHEDIGMMGMWHLMGSGPMGGM